MDCIPARRWLAILGVATLSTAATGASLQLTHPFGDLVDRGDVTARVIGSDTRLDCSRAPHLYREDNEITISAARIPAGAPDVLCDLPPVWIGELSAGWWTFVLRVFEADGSTLVERVQTEARVRTPGQSCNKYPGWSTLIVLHRTMTGAELLARLATDPGFSVRLGSPTGGRTLDVGITQYAVLDYAVLEDPNALRARLQDTGEFLGVQTSVGGCFSAPPPDAMGRVVEYYHALLDHFFYTVDASEIAGLDSGSGARGWKRTGKTFDVLVAPGCPFSRQEQAAYRFFGKPGVGPSSHVFTVDREECRVVDRSGAWLYEGSPFWATPANSAGGCTHADEISLHRLWKPFGDSNHRFTTELAVVGEMKAKGWVHEGVAMCVKK